MEKLVRIPVNVNMETENATGKHWQDVTVPIVSKMLKNKCRYVVKKELKDEAEKNTSVSDSTKTCRNEEH